MYEVLVKMQTQVDLEGKTNEEILALLKKTIGMYSEYDVSKIIEIVTVTREP